MAKSDKPTQTKRPGKQPSSNAKAAKPAMVSVKPNKVLTASPLSSASSSKKANTISTKREKSAKPLTRAGSTKALAKSSAKDARKASANSPASEKRAIKSTSKSALAGKKVFAGKKTPTEIDDKFVQSSQSDINTMIKALCELYPDAHCELDYNSTFQLLTAVILSAQTTDVGVNKCTPALFKKFPDAKALAEADIEEVKPLIRSTGYFNAKAQNIQRCAQALVERFGGAVPKTLEELTTLPGVGRKTANVVLGVCFNEPGWTVDTHVQRLVRRLGFTPETDPVKIEFALQKIFPNQDWSKYSITIIWHGRRICYARNPNCTACPLNQICPSSQV